MVYILQCAKAVDHMKSGVKSCLDVIEHIDGLRSKLDEVAARSQVQTTHIIYIHIYTFLYTIIMQCCSVFTRIANTNRHVWGSTSTSEQVTK